MESRKPSRLAKRPPHDDITKEVFKRRLTPLQAEVLFALWRADREGNRQGQTYEEIFERLKKDAELKLAQETAKAKGEGDGELHFPSIRMIKKTVIQLTHWRWIVIESRPSLSRQYMKGRIPNTYFLQERGIVKSPTYALLLVESYFSPNGDLLDDDFLQGFMRKTGVTQNQIIHMLKELRKLAYIENHKTTDPEFPILSFYHRTEDELPYLIKVAAQWNPDSSRPFSLFST